jgi:hypothetical protein
MRSWLLSALAAMVGDGAAVSQMPPSFLLQWTMPGVATGDLALAPTLRVRNTHTGSRAPLTIARIGDYDADGSDDLAIGFPDGDAGGDDCGKVVVLSGRSGETLNSYSGESAGSRFGASICGARDIAFDGHARLIVGAPGRDGGRGAVYVFGGAKRKLTLRILGSQPNESFGACVADAIDADNDGKFDFLVGAPLFDGEHGVDSGRVRVISGKSKDDRIVELALIEGSAAGEEFGSAAATVESAAPGMFHAVAVGAPGAIDPGTGVRTGAVRVYSAKTWELGYERMGAEADQRFGQRVTSVGQWKPIDGASDFAVASSARGQGVAVFCGKTGAPLAVIDAPSEDVAFGCSLAGGGDLDKDGVGDLLVGAVGDVMGSTDGALSAYVVLGADRRISQELAPAQPGDELGAAVAITGNFLADGFASACTVGFGMDGVGIVQCYTTKPAGN